MIKNNIPIIVSSVLLIFVIIVIANSKRREENVSNAFVTTIDSVVYEEGIDREEGIVLAMLNKVNLKYTVDKLSNIDSVDYHGYLRDYFIKTSYDIESSALNELIILLNDLKSISELENETNIRNMTMQSRTLALHSIESIYKICGLNMEYTFDGIILKISDNNNIYYVNRNMNNSNSIRYHSLIMVIAILILLYITCFMIVKKNRLYVKGEKYDELKEKGFA